MVGQRRVVSSGAWMVGCLLAASGCDLIFLQEQAPDAGRATDAASVDAQRCHGTNVFEACLADPLPPAINLIGVIDTGSDKRCVIVRQASGRDVCVIAAQAVTVPSTLIVTGAHPLAVVSANEITIDAPVDASSSAMRSGPGAQPDCGRDGDGTGTSAGGGGGAGGSFGWPGGFPQPGGGDPTTAHGAALPAPLVDVRGGCPGYRGGVVATDAGTPAAGGAGGGAVWLLAATKIVVTARGSINASGSGGAGGPIRGGGGGGGAGGLIGLEAPDVRIEGHVFARGGGGGSGGSTTTAGLRGSEASNATLGTPHGGSAPTTGTGAGPGWPGCGGPNGRQGGSNSAPVAAAGGGGAGGGCGILRVIGQLTLPEMITSPAPS